MSGRDDRRPGPITMSHTYRGGDDGTGRWIRESLKPSRLAWGTGVTLSPLGG